MTQTCAGGGHRCGSLLAVAVVVCWLLPAVAEARPGTPGRGGIGDPYFPLAGNGGYDVGHYGLELWYDAGDGRAARRGDDRATATQKLSSFNLDLVGLTVHSVTVNGRAGALEPQRRRADDHAAARRCAGGDFTTVVAYGGMPETLGDAQTGISGFIHTDDGTLVAGEPRRRRDLVPGQRPSDRQGRYSFGITVPRGLEAIANGELHGVERRGRVELALGGEGADGVVPGDGDDRRVRLAPTRTTASVLGRDRSRSARAAGPHAAAARDDRDRRSRATSGCGGGSTCRPAARSSRSGSTATPSPAADFFFVEAHGAGARTGRRCPTATATPAGHRLRLPGGCELHPFLEHYLTARRARLSAREGRPAHGGPPAAKAGLRALDRGPGARSPASGRGLADARQRRGLPVRRRLRRRHQRRRRPGSTSFERDGDPLDGWTVAGRAARQPGEPERLDRRDEARRRRRRAARSRRRALDRAARDPALPGRPVRAVPVLGRRARSSTTRGPRLRAREPTRPIYSQASPSDSARAKPTTRRRPRARPPVGRRLARAVARLARHLAQRGLRDLRRMAVERAPGPRSAQAIFDNARRRDAPPSRSGSCGSAIPARSTCRHPGLRPRRDDLARAAQADRRSGVLPAAAGAGSSGHAGRNVTMGSSSRSPSAARARSSTGSSARGSSPPRKPAGIAPATRSPPPPLQERLADRRARLDRGRARPRPARAGSAGR